MASSRLGRASHLFMCANDSNGNRVTRQKQTGPGVIAAEPAFYAAYCLLLTADSAQLGGIKEKMKKAQVWKPEPFSKLIPATTDSPTQSPAQNHAPWRA
jgi:hypothetical protein